APERGGRPCLPPRAASLRPAVLARGRPPEPRPPEPPDGSAGGSIPGHPPAAGERTKSCKREHKKATVITCVTGVRCQRSGERLSSVRAGGAGVTRLWCQCCRLVALYSFHPACPPPSSQDQATCSLKLTLSSATSSKTHRRATSPK